MSEAARDRLRQLEDTCSRLRGYVRQLRANADLFCNQFSRLVRDRLESVDRQHWLVYVRQWFTKYLALKDECLLLINGELIYKYQKAEHAAFVHDRGSERRVYRENTELSACSIDGWNYMCRHLPKKLSSKIEERLEELSLQVEQLGSEIHELFRRRLKDDPLQYLGVCGREYSIDDADKAERLFFHGQLVLERNTTKFKLNRHAVFAMVVDDDPALQAAVKPTAPHRQKRRRRLLDGDFEDEEEEEEGDGGNDDERNSERPMDVPHPDDGDGSQNFDVSISALKRDLGVDVDQMQEDHDQLLSEVGMAGQEFVAVDDDEGREAPVEDDSAFFSRLEAAWEAADYEQVIAIARSRLALRRKKGTDPDRSVLLKALGVALREVGQLAESKRALDEAVQAAVDHEDVLNEERAWTELGNTLLAMHEQQDEQRAGSLLDSLESAYSKSLRLARRLAKNAEVDPALLPTSLYNYAHAQYLRSNMAGARTSLAEALAVGQQDAVMDREQFDALHHVLGLIWELMADVEISDPDNRLKSPAQCLEMAMQEFQRAHNEHDAERLRCCLADQRIQDGDFDKAIEVAESGPMVPMDDGSTQGSACNASLLELRERARQLRLGRALWCELSKRPAVLSDPASLKDAVERWSVDERECAWRYATSEFTRTDARDGGHVDAGMIERYSAACAVLADAAGSSSSSSFSQWQARRDMMISQRSPQPIDGAAEDARAQLFRSFVEADLGKSNDFWKRRAGATQAAARKPRGPVRGSVSRTTIDRSAVPIGTEIVKPRQRKQALARTQQQSQRQQQPLQQQCDWNRGWVADDGFSLETAPLAGAARVSILLFVEGTTFAIATTLHPQHDGFLEVQQLAGEAQRRLWAVQRKIVHVTHLVASRALLCDAELTRPGKLSKEQVLPLHARIPVKQLLEGVTDAGLYSNTFDCAIDGAQQPALDRYAQLCVQRDMVPDWQALHEVIAHGKLSAATVATATASVQLQPLAALCLASSACFRLTEVDFSFVPLSSAEELGELLFPSSSSTVRRLRLAHCGITARMLCDACKRGNASTSLELLDASYNPLLARGPSEMVTMLRALLRRCPSLQELNLNGVFADPAFGAWTEAAAAADGLGLPDYEHSGEFRRTGRLDVRMQQVACSLETWEEIVAFLGAMPMQALDLRGSTVEDQPRVRLWALNAMQVLLTASNIVSLEFGDLYGGLTAQHEQQPAHADDVAASCALIDNVAHPQCHLEQLRLRTAGVSCVPAQQLLQAAVLYCNLQCLDLSYNRLGRQVFAPLEALQASLQMCTSSLRRLYLRGTGIGYDGVCAALAMSRTLQSLEILDLADNVRVDQGGDREAADPGMLVAAVKQLCAQGQQLRVLDLSQNGLSRSVRDQVALVCQPHFFIPVSVLDPECGVALDCSSPDSFCLARTSATT